MAANKSKELTTPDLVVLSLLAEAPMHGYQANAELERRQVRDWAGVSRPQVYYSLEKLARWGLLRAKESEEAGGGPERQVYSTSEKGRAALADSLEREYWATQRDRPPFLTWLALSWQARPGVVLQQLKRRNEFLNRELAREIKTNRAVMAEVGHKYHEALFMLSLTIQQIRLEKRWLRRLSYSIQRRAAALHAPILYNFKPVPLRKV
jgi:DNA-binding PadR family transcriptional regulator